MVEFADVLQMAYAGKSNLRRAMLGRPAKLVASLVPQARHAFLQPGERIMTDNIPSTMAVKHRPFVSWEGKRFRRLNLRGIGLNFGRVQRLGPRFINAELAHSKRSFSV